MINRLDEYCDGLTKLCRRDVFGTRIEAYLRTYGKDCSFASFFVQHVDDIPCAAVSLVDDAVTVCCNERAGFEELSGFLAALPVGSVLAQANILKAMGLMPSRQGHIVKFVSPKKRVSDRSVKYCGWFELEDLYDILNRSDFEGLSERSVWLADVSARIKKGVATGATLAEDGQSAACAMVLFETDTAVLIGAVATLPEFRCRGLAGHLVTSLAQRAEQAGKRAELLCADGGILKFYESLGFEAVGRWAQYAKNQP